MRRQSQREAQKDPTRALGSLDQALAEYESSSSEPNREIHCSGRLLLLPFHSTKSIPSTTPTSRVSYSSTSTSLYIMHTVLTDSIIIV